MSSPERPEDNNSESQPQNNPSVDLVRAALEKKPRPLQPRHIATVLEGKLVRDEHGVPRNFETMYAYNERYIDDNAVIDKFDIAHSLIVDGRYPHMDIIFDHFAVEEHKGRPDLEVLVDRLKLAMVENNRYKTGSKEEKQAREAFARLILQDEELQELMDKLPLGFMGSVAQIKLLAQAKSPEERERLRVFATRSVSLLRERLGDFTFAKPRGQISFERSVHLMPEQVLEDPDSVTYNLAEYYYTNETLRYFVDGEEAGFARMKAQIEAETSPAKKKMLQNLYDEYKKAQAVEIPAVFNPEVVKEEGSTVLSGLTAPAELTDVSHEDLEDPESIEFEDIDALEEAQTVGGKKVYPFPAFRQKYFVYQFLSEVKKGRDLLCGDTGATKTACSYLAMEAAGAEHVTIFGPARARDTWPQQASQHFKTPPPDVFCITDAEDLKKTDRLASAKYVYISSELLGRSTDTVVNALAQHRQTDGVILDEAHVFSNEGTNATKGLRRCLAMAEQNYKPKHELDIKMPMIALTATPIHSSLTDMDVPMALLYPDRYCLQDEQQPGVDRYVFSTVLERNPKAAFILLHGEKLMTQWSTEDLFGPDVPKLRFEDVKRVPIELTPYERTIYEWVSNISSVDSLYKVWLMRAVLLNPGIIRDINNLHTVTGKDGKVEQKQRWHQTTKTKLELEQTLKAYHDCYVTWAAQRNPNLEVVAFSPDWIAQYGTVMVGGEPVAACDFLVESFFHPEVIDSVNGLTRLLPKGSWPAFDTSSSKFKFIKKHLEDTLHLENGTYKGAVKTAIISPEVTQGITHFSDDEFIKPGSIPREASFSLYELMFMHGLPRDILINVDGSRPFPDRRRIAQEFREMGDKYMAILMSLESMSESLDMAPRAMDSMGNIEQVIGVLLGWPYEWVDAKQMFGRFIRPHLGKAFEAWVLEAQDTLDPNLFNVVRRKFLIMEQMLAGIEPSEEDREFLRQTTKGGRLIEVSPNSGQFFIRRAIQQLRGLGEEDLIKQLSEIKEGSSNFDKWAEFYFEEGMDQFRVVGNNAELVSRIFMGGEGPLLSIGAGTCLLDRKLKAAGYKGEVFNADINTAVMEVARANHPEVKNVEFQRASQMTYADGTFDNLDCSLVLDMTKLYEDDRLGTFGTVAEIERVKALREFNRVVKVGGKVVLTLPDSCLDQDSFVTFVTTLQTHFGFAAVPGECGQSWASDIKPKRKLGWIITLEKTEQAVDISTLDPNGLHLLTDDRFGISRQKEPKKPQQGSGVIRIESPFFNASNFEIVDPLTNESTEILDADTESQDEEAAEAITEAAAEGDVAEPEDDEEEEQSPVIVPETAEAETAVVESEAAVEVPIIPVIADRRPWWDRMTELVRVQITQKGAGGISTDEISDVLATVAAGLENGSRDWWRQRVNGIEEELRQLERRARRRPESNLPGLPSIPQRQQAEFILAAWMAEQKVYERELRSIGRERVIRDVKRSIESYRVSARRMRRQGV